MAYRQVLSSEQLLRRVRFQFSMPHDEETEELAGMVLADRPGDDGGASLRSPEAARFLQEIERPGVPNLSLVWTSALRALAAQSGLGLDPVTIPGIAAGYLSGGSAHTVFVGPQDDLIVAALRSTAALRIAMKSTAGRVFVWGEHPITPSFVLSDGDDATGRPYRLIRMV